MIENCGNVGKEKRQEESSCVTQLEKVVLATLPFYRIVKLVILAMVDGVVIVIFTHS